MSTVNSSSADYVGDSRMLSRGRAQCSANSTFGTCHTPNLIPVYKMLPLLLLLGK